MLFNLKVLIFRVTDVYQKRGLLGGLNNSFILQFWMTVKKSMHDIRRTCLTTMYDRGIKIRQLQYFAGHSTPEQTMDYIPRKNDVEIDEWLIDDRDLPNSETEETALTPIIPFCAVGDNGDKFWIKKTGQEALYLLYF